MLITEVTEVERLNEENADLKRQLEVKEQTITNAGSIAEASMQLNGVFFAAQAAAEQYLMNIRRVEQDCDEVRAEAEAHAAEVRAEADKHAAEVEESARQSAEA